MEEIKYRVTASEGGKDFSDKELFDTPEGAIGRLEYLGWEMSSVINAIIIERCLIENGKIVKKCVKKVIEGPSQYFGKPC